MSTPPEIAPQDPLQHIARADEAVQQFVDTQAHISDQADQIRIGSKMVRVMTMAARLYDDVGMACGEPDLVKAVMATSESPDQPAQPLDLFGIPDHRVYNYRDIAARGREWTTSSELVRYRENAWTSLTALRRFVFSRSSPDRGLRDSFRHEGEGKAMRVRLLVPQRAEAIDDLSLTEQLLVLSEREMLLARAKLTAEQPGNSEVAAKILLTMSERYRYLGIAAVRDKVSRGEVSWLALPADADGDEAPIVDMTELTPQQINMAWIMSDHPGEVHSAKVWQQFWGLKKGDATRRFENFMEDVQNPHHPARRLADVVEIVAKPAGGDDSADTIMHYGIKGSRDHPEFAHVPDVRAPRPPGRTKRQRQTNYVPPIETNPVRPREETPASQSPSRSPRSPATTRLPEERGLIARRVGTEDKPGSQVYVPGRAAETASTESKN